MGFNELLTELKRSWWKSKFSEVEELAMDLEQEIDCVNKFARKIVVIGNSDELFDTLKNRIENMPTPILPWVKLVDVSETENNYAATIRKIESGYSLARKKIELQKHGRGVDIMQSA